LTVKTEKELSFLVDREITLPEDRDILRKYDVKFGPPVDSTGRKRTGKICIYTFVSNAGK
jgi:hypothetical protein